MMRVDDRREPAQIGDLPRLHQLPGAPGQPLDDAVLETAQLVEVDLRLAEVDAPALRVLRFVDELGDVQQRFRRNASAIDADAAWIGFGVDERDAEPEIRGEECASVSAGTCADDCELCGDHPLSAITN